ncbi:hypothetical protein EVAR_42631_1 [Eumeta japonica]|uniref:Uncharacterized protein n=1 Tax=Eumeta variegata TaxID=151549 RepID=A0A4C1WZI6_EUMVA|nr:hypothetical protein EVAR_42631_1 [Eumeta japonica]
MRARNTLAIFPSTAQTLPVNGDSPPFICRGRGAPAGAPAPSNYRKYYSNATILVSAGASAQNLGTAGKFEVVGPFRCRRCPRCGVSDERYHSLSLLLHCKDIASNRVRKGESDFCI